MADPQNLLAKVPRRTGPLASLLAEETSTVFESELTADTSPERYVISHDGIHENSTTQYEPYARITGFDVDYTDCDDLTFPGFAPMRDYLALDAARYLVSERRWCNEGDSVDVIGQKNAIIIFVCIATMEEFLVGESREYSRPAIRPFTALMGLLGISDERDGLPRSYNFLVAIRTAFVSSRCKAVDKHLKKGIGPTEPGNLTGLGRMLLDVMDRHIAFKRTQEPLAQLDTPLSLEALFSIRLEQLEKQLCNKEGIEKCFTTFVPTIPANQQVSWPRVGMATSWEAAKTKMMAKHLERAVETNHSKHPEYRLSTAPTAPMDAYSPFEVKPVFTIPGIPADGPMRPLQSALISPTGHPDDGHRTETRHHDTGLPNALSGLRIFKTAVCQIHKVIRGSRDSMDFRMFIGQIENDVEQFHAKLPGGPALTMAGSAGATGVLGAELDVLLDRQYIRSLMNTGLCLIRNRWYEPYLTDDFRQKIRVEVLEELRMIEDAADQVCSDEA